MELFKIIMTKYPEIGIEEFGPYGSIKLQDDSDGKGVYIAEWNYSEPIPDGLKIGK
jgi:hypothetical protein